MMATSQPGQLGGDQQRELKVVCMNNLLAATDVRIYFKDLLSRFILISSAYIVAYAPGRTAEELIGQTDFDLFSYAHAYAAHNDEQEIIRTGRPMLGKMERETYKDRPDAWVLTTKLPLRDDHGRIIGTFGISRDITAQIAAGPSQA